MYGGVQDEGGTYRAIMVEQGRHRRQAERGALPGPPVRDGGTTSVNRETCVLRRDAARTSGEPRDTEGTVAEHGLLRHPALQATHRAAVLRHRDIARSIAYGPCGPKTDRMHSGRYSRWSASQARLLVGAGGARERRSSTGRVELLCSVCAVRSAPPSARRRRTTRARGGDVG